MGRRASKERQWCKPEVLDTAEERFKNSLECGMSHELKRTIAIEKNIKTYLKAHHNPTDVSVVWLLRKMFKLMKK